MSHLARKAKLKTAGRRSVKGDGNGDYAFWVRHRMSELRKAPTPEQTATFLQWMAERKAVTDAEYTEWIASGRTKLFYQFGRSIGMKDTFNNPIRIFYANLLYLGIKVGIEDGQLVISGKTRHLSPAYQDEITKRSKHLIELLSVEAPEELAPYCLRLISNCELTDALCIADRIQANTRGLPVNGGWLLEFIPLPEGEPTR